VRYITRMMDREDRWDPYPLDQIAATTSGTSPPAQETPPNDLLSSIFDFAMIFWHSYPFSSLSALSCVNYSLQESSSTKVQKKMGTWFRPQGSSYQAYPTIPTDMETTSLLSPSRHTKTCPMTVRKEALQNLSVRKP
jgi:Tfp pilus assembly protein PilV